MPKRRRMVTKAPEVNLVPMLDVLMTVLTFFIIISMTLTGQASFNLKLPSAKQGVKEARSAPMMVVSLDSQGEITLDGQKGTVDQLARDMARFLDTNPTGLVVLKADSQLDYDKVANLLGIMRDIGGDSVSLAVEQAKN